MSKRQQDDIRLSIWLNDKNAQATMADLTRWSQKLRREVNKQTVGTKEYYAAVKNYRQVQSTLNKHRQDLRGVETGWNKAKKGALGFFSPLTAGLASVAGLTAGLRKLVSANSQLADAMADTQKTTGLTNDEMDLLVEKLDAIDTRSSREELLKLAEEAGRLGYQGVGDISRFVEAADQLRVALGDDLGGEAAIRDVGKLTQTYKIAEREGVNTAEAMLKLGSAINEVSASGANQAGFLVDYLKRLTGLSAQTTLTAEQQIGFAAAFDETGQSVEVAGTAMNQVIANMYKDTATYAEIAGVSQQEFADLLKTDTNQALLLFLEGLNGNNEGLSLMATKLDDLGIDGSRATSVLAAISSNLDLVRERQVQASEALEKGTSLTEEFNRKNENLAANLEKLSKWFNNKIAESSAMRGLERFSGYLVRITQTNASDSLEKDRLAMRALAIQATDANVPQERRVELIKQLKDLYPEYFESLDEHRISNVELKTAIDQANESLLERVRIMAQEETMQESMRQMIDLSREQQSVLQEANERIIAAEEKGLITINTSLGGIERLQDALSQLAEIDGVLPGAKNAEEAMLEALIRRASHLDGLINNINEEYANQQSLLDDLTAKQTAYGIEAAMAGRKAMEEFAKITQSQAGEEPTSPDGDAPTPDKKWVEAKEKAAQELETYLENLDAERVDKEVAKLKHLLALADKYGLDRVALEQRLAEKLDEQAKVHEEARLESLQEQADTELKQKEELENQRWQQEQIDLLEKHEFAKMTADQQQRELEQLELDHLNRLLEMRQSVGEDTVELELQIARLRMGIAQDAAKGIENAKKGEAESAFLSARIVSTAEADKKNALAGAGASALMSAKEVVQAKLMESIASALANLFGSLPPPLAAIIGAGIGGLIKGLFNSLISFDVGGYTNGPKGMPDPNLPGRFIQGFAHDDEYVVAKEELMRPDIAGLVDYIETARTARLGGFSNAGGKSAPSTAAAASSAAPTMSTQKMELLLEQIAMAVGRPAIAVVPDRTIRDITERQEKNSAIKNRNQL